MTLPIQPDQLDFKIHPSGGGSEVSVALITQSLAALQEMIYLAAMQTEGRSLRERLRLPDEIKNRYVLHCAPPQVGSFFVRGRVVNQGGGADLLTPLQTAKVATLVLTFCAATVAGEPGRMHDLMPDSRLRNRMLSCVAKISPPPGSGHRYEIGGAEAPAVFLDEELSGKVESLLRPPELHQEMQTVTGRLHEINFVEHKLTMYHASTQRALECFYDESIEPMLLENRRDLIQVTGQVIMDDNRQPKKIVNVEQIWDLDLSPFSVAEFEVRGVHLHARQAIELVPALTEDEQLMSMEHKPWGLDVFASTRAELLAELKAQLRMLWIEYAQSPDDVLSEPARQVKQQLLADWEEVRRAEG